VRMTPEFNPAGCDYEGNGAGRPVTQVTEACEFKHAAIREAGRYKSQ
jgi:hypothetical protein